MSRYVKYKWTTILKSGGNGCRCINLERQKLSLFFLQVPQLRAVRARRSTCCWRTQASTGGGCCWSWPPRPSPPPPPAPPATSSWYSRAERRYHQICCSNLANTLLLQEKCKRSWFFPRNEVKCISCQGFDFMLVRESLVSMASAQWKIYKNTILLA